MRIGINPEKKDHKLSTVNYHRVVIPVYIPNLEEDYFKDALIILKLCFSSLLNTIHNKTKISIINNGCCDEAGDYLDQLYKENNNIDQLLNSKINLGKVNALYSAIKSNLEPLITVADADVMFLNNWQEEVEKVFKNFPEAGMVSPVPGSISYRGNYLNSTVFYSFFKGKLKFKDVIDREGLIKFQESIGRHMYNENHLQKYLVVSNKRGEAVLGCGHFVATLRSQAFRNSPLEPSNAKIVGGSENKYIDSPNDKSGFLRLSTKGNFAYHLGNKYEDWMQEAFSKIKPNENDNVIDGSFLSNVAKISKANIFIGKLLHKVFLVKYKKMYFKYKGMKRDY